MTLNLSIPEQINDIKPKISVIGIGGAGGNAVNTMINANVENIEFIAANTDGQALSRSLTSRQIQLGKNITSGLGAGSDSEIGRQAAEESLEEIIAELGDSNMLFITTGMGGGTGSGAAPVIAKAAKEKGILTVAVVTKPFDFEGKKRMEVAENGLASLKENVDTLIVIPNQNLFKIANEKTTFADAFKMADDVLYQGVCGITNLITNPGMINLDFADIRTVMGNMGKAMMGTGESSGEERARKAAEEALNNPLLDDSNIRGAKSILLNIQGGPDMALFEVDEAASKIRNEVDENANIIFGSSIDSSLEGIIKVSIVATGIDTEYKSDPIVAIKSEENERFDLKDELEESSKDDLEEGNLLLVEENSEKENNLKNDQIDLETQINDIKVNETSLNKDSTNFEIEELETNFSNEKSDELSSIIQNKPVNKFTDSKPSNLFNRFSSFFGADKNKEFALEQNFNLVKESEIKKEDENRKEEEEKMLINNFKSEIKEDLFSKENRKTDEDLVNLIDVDQKPNEIDEKVLEIPAFLRRQAN